MTESLTKESFLQLWKTELLPSIKKDLMVEFRSIKSELDDLSKVVQNIKESQEFLSSKYDEITQALQSIKKQISTTEGSIKKQEQDISSIHENVDELYHSIDDLQQYSRRECLEIHGIPKSTNDNPTQLVKEIGDLTGVKISDDDISIAHRLPDTKKSKDRIIVKFIRRTKKEELYARRRRLVGKSTTDLPSTSSDNHPKRIFINESLTSYRRRILGKVNQYKKDNKFKFLWTINGKILLKAKEDSVTHSFTTEMEFENFVNNRKFNH